MTLEPIGIKVKPEIKAKIMQLIEAGKYQHVSDFMHRAIAAELARDGTSIDQEIRLNLLQSIRDDIRTGDFDDVIDARIKHILLSMADVGH